MRGAVALVAGQARMLALERIAGLVMIKILFGRHPVNEREVPPVVFRMALSTLLVVRELAVQSLRLSKFLGNLGVALLALQSRCTQANLVTARALCGAAKRCVGCGKRTRRNLRPHRRGRKNQRQEKHQRTDMTTRPDSEVLHR